MRILFLHQYFCPPTGYGNNRSYELSKYWVQAQQEVIMVTSSAHFPPHHPAHQKKVHFEVIDGIQTYVLNVPYSHYFNFGKRIVAFVKFYYEAQKLFSSLPKPDLVYASSTPPSVGELGRKWAQKWNVPLFFETVDVWPDVPQQMKILRNPFLLRYLHHKVNNVYKFASKIIALSPDMKKLIMSHGVPEDKILVSYNGTNVEKFYPVERSNAIPKVLYAGTVGKANEVSNFVLAAKALEGSADFLLLGNGNDAPTVQKLIQQCKPRNLTWKTWIPKNELQPIMAQCDIGVCLFANYKILEANSANKFYDYLACGLPVVNNYEGWQKNFLEQHHCGLGSKLGNLSHFLENLQQCIQNPALRKTMGINARTAAEKYFDRKKIASDLLQEFRSILNNFVCSL